MANLSPLSRYMASQTPMYRRRRRANLTVAQLLLLLLATALIVAALVYTNHQRREVVSRALGEGAHHATCRAA